MSYDYLMFRRPGPWPHWVKRFGLIFGNGQHYPLGTPEELMARIDGVIPGVRWREERANAMTSVAARMAGAKFSPGGSIWAGRGGPEFQFGTDADGSVKFMFVSRAEPREIRTLCRRLSLTYMDMQADGFLGILFR